jgi:hypothetical protein
MQRISKWLKKDLVRGNTSGCIRNGLLYFNKIEVGNGQVNLFHKGKMVITFSVDRPVNFSAGESLIFILEEGTMKVRLS